MFKRLLSDYRVYIYSVYILSDLLFIFCLVLSKTNGNFKMIILLPPIPIILLMAFLQDGL